MKGTSKVIMGATLVMVVSLAIVLGLVLVLLAELYCSLLLRKRKLKNTSSTSTATPATAIVATASKASSSQPTSSQEDQPSSSPLSSIYAQGVLHAPRSFLFPSLTFKDDKAEGKDHKQHPELHQVLEIQSHETSTSPHHIGLISISSPANSIAASPKQLEVPIQSIDKTCVGGEHLVYISNPIYENDGRLSQVGTPFETPDTSPSRLGNSSGASSGEEEGIQSSPKGPDLLPGTPPLTPMKKLPAEACSVSLRDARSLGTSPSDTNSINCASSSSSGSPCTSPSW